MRIGDNVWVVTGAGGGIGRELALQLLQRGARVAAVDISPDGLAGTAERAPAADLLSRHVVDITDRDAVQALVGAVLAVHGTVDAVVNNAGIIQPFVPFTDLDEASLHRVLDVNLMGTIHMTRAFLPVLLERPAAHLVNVSSMGGFFPFPNQTMYGASKAAVTLLTEGLFAELLDTPVSVSVVFPGPTDTGIASNLGLPADAAQQSRMPLTSAADAARMALDGIERDRLHIYLGTMARLANIAIRIAPRAAITFVRAQMTRLMADAVPQQADEVLAASPTD
jgi:short-subunit dehydrogenase